MRMRRGWAFLIPLVMLLVPSVVPGGIASAAPEGAPRLELRAPSTSIDVFRYGHRERVTLDLPVYLASHGAPFDLRIRRESYDDPIRVFQAFHGSSGVSLQELPADVLLEGWNGLADFIRVRLTSEDGSLVRRRVSGICPAGWESQRIDDSGPFEATYPEAGCYATPFTLGLVWGVDQGWAVLPTWTSDTSVRVPNGRYHAVVAITSRYRELFAIAPEDAKVQLDVRIRTWRGCNVCGAEGSGGAGDRTRLTAAPDVTDPDPGTVPDLASLPAFGIGTERQRGRDLLTFGSNLWNRGPASLVVEGFRREGEDLMDAYQYFLQDGVIVGRALVGSFMFDDRLGHGHWHMRQFVRYRLLDQTLANVVRSHKQSFCLAPTDAIDLGVDGAVWRPGDIGFSHCGWAGSLWIREIVPTGWGDTYYQGVAGQAFDITDVPNGTFWIEVRANPLGALFDADPSNDTELREVILGGRPGARTVTVPPWHGIDTG